MMGFMITYESESGRKRRLLAVAKSFNVAKKIAEKHCREGEKIAEIAYVPDEKI